MKLENNYWNRWFLMCNELANTLLGLKQLNFAKLIIEEESGRYGNAQMTVVFHKINAQLSDTFGNDYETLREETNFEELSKFEPDQLEEYYSEYCCGRQSIEYHEG